MIMTSVSGHLLQLEFTGSYRYWQACSPMSLFDAPVKKYCPQDYQQIKVLVCDVYIFLSNFRFFYYYTEYCHRCHMSSNEGYVNVDM